MRLISGYRSRIVLEIKPNRPTEEETEKAQRLATFTGKQVAVCFSPLEIEWTSYWEDSVYLLDCDKRYSSEYFSWYQCPSCHRLQPLSQRTGTHGDYPCICGADGDRSLETEHLVRAYEIARGFRFF